MKVRSQSSSNRTIPSEGSLAERKKGGGWTCARALEELRALGERRNVDGMARFGIRAKVVYGVAKPKMDELARRIGKDHQLALELWASGVHDARILAGMIDLPREVSSEQMERWVRDFDNWDVCDGTCCHLFVFAAPAWRKAMAWSRCGPEFIKRAGFALMAYLAYRDKQAADAQFRRVLPLIEREAYDDAMEQPSTAEVGVRTRSKRLRSCRLAACEQTGAPRERHACGGERAGRKGATPQPWRGRTAAGSRRGLGPPTRMKEHVGPFKRDPRARPQVLRTQRLRALQNAKILPQAALDCGPVCRSGVDKPLRRHPFTRDVTVGRKHAWSRRMPPARRGFLS